MGMNGRHNHGNISWRFFGQPRQQMRSLCSLRRVDLVDGIDEEDKLLVVPIKIRFKLF